MKTILLISPYWKESHRWMVSSVKLAELWQRMGYRVVAVCMGAKTEREVVSNTLTIYHVKDYFLPDPFNYGIAPTFFFHVFRTCKNEKPDIVVVNKILFWSSIVTPLLRLLGKKPIVTVDALVGMTWWPRTRFTTILCALFAWTQGWLVLLSAKRVVFFHPQPEKLLKRLGIAKKSQVIPTGIDHTKHECVVHENRDRVTVTYVGRLESVKGVDDFLEAVVPLKASYPRLHIQVVGWYKENHPLVSQYFDSVEFTGLRHDIPAILKETDIFVLPSYSEGLSNALMEAMSSGCACVASEVGGNRFLIENGVSGFLFSPGDREMLASHVRRLIDDTSKRQSLALKARERIEKVFSWSVTEANYATLFADA
jgi:glycosyltransferase involved in cell wall biosynthesis